MPDTLSALDFGVSPSATDNARAFARVCHALRNHPGATLVIPPGIYHMHPLEATGAQVWLTNHDNGFDRRIALDLQGLRDVTIEGAGATLMLHGQIVPLLLRDCRNVTIRGLTIDWATPLHAWGEVIGGWNGFLDVRVTAGHPWRIHRERLAFVVDGKNEEMWGSYACDPVTLGNLAGSGDHCGTAWGVPWIAEDRGNGVVRLLTHTPKVPPVGTTLILRHGDRIAPAIAADRCRDLRLDHITIHQASGMGVLCQRCWNVTLSGVKVIPSAGRPLSANHDATHFLACRGTVRVDGGTFTHQLDDGLNCHGLYAPVTARDGKRILVRLVHAQQRGNLVAEPGEKLGIIDQETLRTIQERTVVEVLPLSAEFTELTLDAALPETAKIAVENLDWRCDLAVTGNRFAHNRARGVLVSNGLTALVADNHFTIPGAAVLVAVDANFWYESGATRDIAIRGNRFDHCAVGGNGWGDAVILVKPEIQRHDGPVHGRIAVTGNTVTGGGATFADVSGCAEFVAEGNIGAGTVVRR